MRSRLRRSIEFVALALPVLVTALGARADALTPLLSDALVREVFPAMRYYIAPEGDPPAAAIYDVKGLAGYVFASSDVVDTVGFANAPFTIVVGIDLDGRLTGAKVVDQHEPIIDVNMLQGSVEEFTKQYDGLEYGLGWRIEPRGRSGEGTLDGVSSATISAILFNQAIIQGARIIARAHDAGEAGAAVDMMVFEPAPWPELIENEAIARLQVTGADLPSHPDNGPVIDLYAAMVAPTSIGRNLLGGLWYRLHVATRDPADLVFLVMANGSYSFVGTDVYYSGTFDRVRVVQNDTVFPLTRENYRFIPFLKATDGPTFSEIGMFWLPLASGIDPLAPWRLELDVADEEAANPGATTTFSLPYSLSERYILPSKAAPQATPPPAAVWRAVWAAQSTNLAILAVVLGLLVAMLTAMAPLARRPRLYTALRLGFLAVVLVWMGWWAGAQLSVINVLTWLQALIDRSDPTMLLFDPLILVLTLFTLVSFVLWGRGVFCGWLCPFGALQELLSRVARLARVPQVSLSLAVHKRLWPVKYVVLAALVALSFHSMTAAGTGSEIEPFKTAISLKFVRDWPYLIYALTLLAATLVVERLFCRFLCPLGAVMVIGGKLRLFNPLVRRAECGDPCQLCARKCPIQAIERSGAIRMDECFYCLDCQSLYYDEHRCPPLIADARRRARAPINAVAAE